MENTYRPRVTIGIDVSKSKLDIVVLPDRIHTTISNSRLAIKKFIHAQLKRYRIQMVALEVTGGYEKELCQLLAMCKVPYHAGHPNRIYHYAKAKGLLGKTDKADALILARYAGEPDTKATVRKEAGQQQLLELSTRRQQLQSLLVAEKNRALAPSDRLVKESAARIIGHLEKELARIEATIAKLIASSEDLQQASDLLQSFKGVAQKTAHVLVAQLPELGSASKTQIAALAGLAPLNRDSGRKQGKRKITGGRAGVRKALYMCALATVRFNAPLRSFYQKLREKGKTPKVALIAVARKMVIILNSMLQHQTPWQEHYQKTPLTTS